MTMVKVTDQDYYMDGFLQSNLDTAIKVSKKDWDMVFIIDGSEGSGKSILAMQCAYYCDNTFNADREAYSPDEFKERIIKAKQYNAVVYDEAMTGLSSRSAMSNVNKALVSMLAEIRQKNLFVFIVLPTFFDLDKYAALWRSRALLHVYTGDDFKRGYFAFYNVEKKKDLYINGKKYYSYGKPRPNFIGRFTNHYTISEDDYRAKKRASLLARENEEHDYLEKRYKERFTVVLAILAQRYKLVEIERMLLAKGIELSSARISQLLKAYAENKEESPENSPYLNLKSSYSIT